MPIICIHTHVYTQTLFDISDHGDGSESHHMEVLQKLIEMERRSNSKPISLFGVAGHCQGMYGHDQSHNSKIYTR